MIKILSPFFRFIEEEKVRPMPAAMAVAIDTSRFVSSTLTPLLASRWPERVVDVFSRPVQTVDMKLLTRVTSEEIAVAAGSARPRFSTT